MGKRLSPLLALATLASACSPQPDEFARAVVIERLDQAVGGPKAAARPGDILLENEHLRVAILAATRPDGEVRYSLGPALFGGTLADADLQRSGAEFASGKGRDQFAEMFATTSLNVTRPDQANDVRIVRDGSDGGEAIVRVEGEATPFLSLLSALWALTDVPDMRMVTDYIVEPGVPWLRMRTAVRVGPSSNVTDFGDVFPAAQTMTAHTAPFPLIERAIEDGLIAGDFFLVGGSAKVFAPGLGFDEEGLVYRAGLDGQNSFEDPFQFPWLVGIGDGVSYGIMPDQGDLFVPLFTSSQTTVVGGSVQGDASADDRFRDGDTFSYERYFFVGHGDAGSVYDQVLALRGTPSGTVSGRVTEAGTGLSVSQADVFVYEPGAEFPINQWRTDVRLDDPVADGSFEGQLPVGSWELLVHQSGRPDLARVPIEVTADGSTQVSLQAGRGGVLTFDLTDETGQRIPGKVTLYRTDGPSTRRPDLGDGFIAGAPDAVVFPMYGHGQVELPSGEYRAIASRGLEYELDEHGPFQIDAGHSHHLNFVVERSVMSEGWVSADFHVHSEPSHDSGVSLVDRVRTMACEGVEFFSSTDHDVITDFAPTVEALGMEPWVQTAVGVETTTVEIGHFLAFPLEADFQAESGGALDWTGRTPFDITTSLRQQGRTAGYEPVVFVGHPRAGILGYFDQYGVNPYGGRPGRGGEPGSPEINTPILALTNPLLGSSNAIFDFDAMEIMGTKEMFRLRTPTQGELDRYAAFERTGNPADDVPLAEMLTRTDAEQDALFAGTMTLGYGPHGQIDDWFTMLNLGFRFTALANSDTHSMTTTEAGCPRNYVLVGTDQPSFIDDQEMAEAVRAGRVVASYGPFIQLTLDDAIIGDELVTAAETLTASVDVQAPSWMDLDRVELYENGTLIHSWAVEGSAPARLQESVEVRPSKDSWYVAIAMGDGSLAPVFTPVERPIIDLQAVVVEALSGVEAVSAFLDPAVPVPELYPITPFAVTNPIWVDRDGDGFDAPGVPEWMVEPEPRKAD